MIKSDEFGDYLSIYLSICLSVSLKAIESFIVFERNFGIVCSTLSVSNSTDSFVDR